MSELPHYGRFRDVFLFLTGIVVIPALLATAWRLNVNRMLSRSVMDRDVQGARQALRYGADPNGDLLVGEDQIHSVKDLFYSLRYGREGYKCPILVYAVTDACEKGDVTMLNMLLEHGGNPNLVVPIYNEAQDTIIRNVHLVNYTDFDVEVVQCRPTLNTLVEHGGDVRADHSLSIKDAAYWRESATVKWLIEHGASPTGDGSNLPLTYAVNNLDTQTIKVLLTAGATFGPIDGKGANVDDWVKIAEGAQLYGEAKEADRGETIRIIRSYFALKPAKAM